MSEVANRLREAGDVEAADLLDAWEVELSQLRNAAALPYQEAAEKAVAQLEQVNEQKRAIQERIEFHVAAYEQMVKRYQWLILRFVDPSTLVVGSDDIKTFEAVVRGRDVEVEIGPEHAWLAFECGHVKR